VTRLLAGIGFPCYADLLTRMHDKKSIVCLYRDVGVERTHSRKASELGAWRN